jgi:Helicase conserved C-terminal domain/Zinc finger, C3HC4 type (RING finger)/SNF2-related domain
MYQQTITQRNRQYWTYFKGVFQNELNEDNTRIPSNPPWIKTKLYSHQKCLVAAALALERTKFEGLDCGENRRLYTNFGVIADRVGSGKSLVALSLVKQPLADEREMVTCCRSNNLSMVKHHIPEPTRRHLDAALFIVPHSIMGQWEDYVTKETTLNAVFCRRKKEVCDKSLLNFMDKVDAVFVSSTMWKFFEETQEPGKIQWSRIFIDEADSIQTGIRVNLTANFIWLITASYLNIAFPSGILHNFTSTYYSPPADMSCLELIQTMMKVSGSQLRVDGITTNCQFIKNIVGQSEIQKNAELQAWRVILRNSDEFVNFSFNMPPVKHLQILCKSTANLRILQSLIPNEIMDMLHAGDTRSALAALGVRDESPTSIIESLTTTLRKELEQNRRKLEFNKTLDFSSDAAKQKSIEAYEAKIQSLEARIETIQNRMADMDTTNCPICYSDVDTPTMTPCCKNLFCFSCLCESLKRQAVCPLCRAAITSVGELHVVNKKANVIQEEPAAGPKTKMEEFMQFVEQNPNAKILLFSEYDASFFQLTQEMNRRNISFSAINGSTARISNILQSFAEGTYRVLFLNSRHVGSGLNIVSATDVFLFHKMSSEMEKQIIGRAYRMGRQQPLNVHHLLYQSEMTSAA